MCGISSFIGDENAYRKILDGLLQLQNRGYDSAGISIFEKGNIITHKYASSTNSSALDKLEKYNYQNNHVGIGHTRWATHGAKTDTNSHPHMSFNEKFVVSA
jgi:glucosamine--fructose-6-phosphate aminotransferase (isomerizing)